MSLARTVFSYNVGLSCTTKYIGLSRLIALPLRPKSADIVILYALHGSSNSTRTPQGYRENTSAQKHVSGVRYRNRNRNRVSELFKPETQDTSKTSKKFADMILLIYIACCSPGKYSAWAGLSLARFASDDIQVQNRRSSLHRPSPIASLYEGR